MADPLTHLAVCYGTDKFGYHDYTPNYYKVLKHLRGAPIKMMEIGVGGYGDSDRGGQSLEVWRDFFPLGSITGIDIQEKTMDLGPRVAILQGSQVDEAFLREVEAMRGPFEVVLDDGSHQNEHVIQSFGMLFPALKAGGIYIVEDVQTSFFPRRGGSVSLKQPNSVGFFADLMRRLDGSDADVGEIWAIERFHNIVVLHKADPAKTPPNLFASTCFDMFDGRAIKVVTFGTKDFGTADMSCKVAGLARHGFGPVSAAQVDGADLVVIATDEDSPQTAENIRAVLELMGEETILAVCCRDDSPGFDPHGAIMDLAFRTFVEVDHREIAVHFPDAQVSPLANKIYSVERFRKGVLFHKAPNVYPSNFAFQADCPPAARALEHMGEILQGEAAREGGLVSYADLLVRYASTDAANTVIDRLTRMGATSRQYYELAIARARRAHDKDANLKLCQAAFEAYPENERFANLLANAHVSLRNLGEAERILRSFLNDNPRSRACVATFTNILGQLGAADEAAELTRRTVNLFPGAARAARFRLLAGFLEKLGDYGGADSAKAKAAEWDAKFPAQVRS